MKKNNQYLGIWLVVVTLLFFGISPGYAQEGEPESLFTAFTDTFDGYLKNSTALRLHELDRFVNIQNSLELEYANWFNDSIKLTVAGRAVYDGVYDVEDGLNPKDEEDYRTYVSLREAVLDLAIRKLDLHLGKQQVVWGKTDGFRVTDMVNPLDLRDTASTEFLDQRIPLWMVNIEYYFTPDFSLQTLIIPEMRFNEQPSPQFAEGTTVNSTEDPDVSIKNTEYGLKLSGFFKGWDFTLNYLYSWDDSSTFKQVFDQESEVSTVSPEYERLHIAGGTFATVIWDAVLRGELAAKIGKYYSVNDPTISGMVVEKSLLNYALAFERDLFDLHWLIQAFQETILDYDEAITMDEIQTYLTLQGSKDFLRETLELATFVIYDVNNKQFTFKPSLEYDYSDAINLTCGIDFLVGEDSDSDDENTDRVYVEVKYSF